MWYGIGDLQASEQYALFGVLAMAVDLLLHPVLKKQVMAHPYRRRKKCWKCGMLSREGADAYLGKQLKSVLPIIGILTVCLFLSVYIVPVSNEAMERFAPYPPETIKLIIAFGAGAFILGSVFSLIVGQIGMRIAVAANVRVAAASNCSFTEALKIAYRAGTCTGMLQNGFAGRYYNICNLRYCRARRFVRFRLWRYADCLIYESGRRYLYQSRRRR